MGLVELLLLACIASGAGDRLCQEVQFYRPWSVTSQGTKAKLRKIHTVIIDSEDYVGRLHWIRRDKNVRASVILRERKGKRKRRGKPKQLVVVVPAAWKFIEKVEKVRDETPKDQICELIANWDYISVFQESGLLLTEDLEDPDKATYTFRPLIKNLWEMADESLKPISQALERLALTQSSSSWSRHMKTADLFKPDTRDNEIKQWSDWKFSFVNYIKGIDARMAASMDLVEENLNGDFKLSDMTDEGKGDGSEVVWGTDLIPTQPTAQAGEVHEG